MWEAADFGCARSRILDAEVAGDGVADLQGQWWFWAWDAGVFGTPENMGLQRAL